MRYRACALAVAVSCFAGSAQAQPMGKVTENQVSMDVKAAVIVLGAAADETTLVFYLLPFEPSAEEVSRLQAGSIDWLDGKRSPDPKKWRLCPWARFEQSWSHKEEVGNPKKGSLGVLADNISKPGQRTGFDTSAWVLDSSLSGAVKEGNDVTFASKGANAAGGANTLAWDLKVKGKILARKK